MIGISGQYLISVSVGDIEDFLDENGLIEFTVISEAGNSLPTYILNFITDNEAVLSKLNEGQIIKAKLGKDLDSLKDIVLTTSTFSSANEGSTERYYETKGFAGNIAYVTNHIQQITDKKSGIEVAIETASKYFKVVSNITKSKDKQSWIQPSTSDKAFTNECLMHASLPDSFPVCAITADGRFILKDIKKEIDAKSAPKSYDWKFTREANGANEIMFDSDPVLDSKAGFMNNWLGYGRTTLAYNAQTGVIESIFEEPKTYLALTKEIDKSNAIGSRYNGTRILSGNTHEAYWSVYNHNLQGLATLSRLEMALSFSDDFYDVQPLDIVMMTETSTISDDQASEYHSGLYIVSKVVTSIQARRLTTTVFLNRESINQIKNEA